VWFKGKDSGLKPQSVTMGLRHGESACAVRIFSHTVFGVVLAGGALFLSPQLFYLVFAD